MCACMQRPVTFYLLFKSLMSYSLLWFVKINTELLRGVFTTQRFDTSRWVVNTPRRSSVFIFTNQSNE